MSRNTEQAQNIYETCILTCLKIQVVVVTQGLTLKSIPYRLGVRVVIIGDALHNATGKESNYYFSSISVNLTINKGKAMIHVMRCAENKGHSPSLTKLRRMPPVVAAVYP